jgi:hypothetical protein
MQTNMIGTTVDLKVHITKNQGIRIYRIGADDPRNAAAIREVDLRKKYRYTPTELAQKPGLNTNQSETLREMLKVDGDPAMCHIFEFGKSKHPCYSDQAIALMKERLSNPEAREGLKSEVRRKMSGRSRRSMREAPPR